MRTALAALVAILAVGIGAIVQAEGRTDHDDADIPLRIDLGYDRAAGSTSFLADVCAVEADVDAPECVVPPAGDGAAPAGTVERPEVRSVNLDGDLKTGDGERLPASVLKLEATNIGQDGLLVEATFVPDGVDDEVEGDVYQSRVIVLRSAGPPVILPITLTADERSRTYGLAIVVLILAGFLGLLVRWFNEVGVPLASAYRRVKRARRMLPVELHEVLPANVHDDFVDVAESLEAQDIGGITTRVERIEASATALRRMGRALERTVAVAQRARHFTVPSDPGGRFGEAATNAARRVGLALDALVRAVRDATWSWTDATERKALETRVGKVGEAAEAFEAILDGVATKGDEPLRTLLHWAERIGDRGPEALLDLRALRPPAPGRQAAAEGAESAAPSVYDDYAALALPSELAERKARPTEPNATDSSRQESWLRSLLAVVGSVQGVVVWVVLVVVGILSQVIEDQSYSGSLSDVLELGVWAFGVAVTGVTSLALLGQVKPTPAPATPPPPS